IGCLLANLLGGVGIMDFLFGPLLTLFAAYLTSRTHYAFLAPLPPVLVNGFGVSIYLSILFQVPYFYSVFYVILGEIIACYGLGWFVLVLLSKWYSWKGVKEFWVLKRK
ncbi:MAG: QueT transporter family protein, partial [Candidatus Caldatribacteriaceae bacterium]